MASLFEADIASLKGVGPKRAELFRKLGAPTVAICCVSIPALMRIGVTRCPSAIHA